MANDQKNINTNDQNSGNQNSGNQNNYDQKEFEVPVPNRKSEEITTTEPVKSEQKGQTTGVKPGQQSTGNDTAEQTNDDTSNKVGFQPDEGTGEGLNKEENIQNENDASRPLDKEKRKEPGNTSDPVYKNTGSDWQQDKMNEANNQSGQKKNISSSEKEQKPEREQSGNENGRNQQTGKGYNEPGKPKNMRDDSILNRPKTETYETNEGDNVGGELRKRNTQHTKEEAKRENSNNKI